MGSILKKRYTAHIQAHICTRDNLSDYYIKVNQDVYSYTSYYLEVCPICGGKECARYIGLYFREVVDEKGTYYKNFPILRYLCCRKEKTNKKDFTVSLLPSQLIPYTKYSINFIFKILHLNLVSNKTQKETLDYVASMGRDDIICLSPLYLVKFRSYAAEGLTKFLLCGKYKNKFQSGEKESINDFIRYASDFKSAYCDMKIRGPDILAYDFYIRNGSFVEDSPFLFGTPSQKRKWD